MVELVLAGAGSALTWMGWNRLTLRGYNSQRVRPGPLLLLALGFGLLCVALIETVS